MPVFKCGRLVWNILFETFFNTVNFWQKNKFRNSNDVRFSDFPRLNHNAHVVTFPADRVKFNVWYMKMIVYWFLHLCLMFNWLSLHCKGIHNLWWYHACFRWLIFHYIVYLNCKLMSYCLLQVECCEPRTPKGGVKVILPHVTYCWYQQLSAFQNIWSQFRPFRSASFLSPCKMFFIAVIVYIVYESGCHSAHISTAHGVTTHDIKMHLSAHLIRV